VTHNWCVGQIINQERAPNAPYLILVRCRCQGIVCKIVAKIGFSEREEGSTGSRNQRRLGGIDQQQRELTEKGIKATAKSPAAGFKEIAGAADGLQGAWIFGVGFDFLAQAADADVNTARGEELFAAPDGGEKLLASEDAARVRSEAVEKAEFEQAGGDGFVRAGDAVGVGMDLQTVEIKRLTLLAGRYGAREEQFYAGDKLPWAEGFGDVIVGARLKGGNEVGFAAAHGKHDDRKTVKQGVLADFGENLKSGNAGEHGIEKEEVRWRLLERGEARDSVERFGDVETGFA
jgi:hypothetical protein